MANEIQRLTITGAGSFTLTGPNDVANVDDGLDSGQVIDAINAAVNSSDCSITDNLNNTYDIEFIGALANQNVDPLAISNIVGATPTITTLQQGSTGGGAGARFAGSLFLLGVGN